MTDQLHYWFFKEAITLPFPNPADFRDRKEHAIHVGMYCVLFISATLFLTTGCECLYYSVMIGSAIPEFDFSQANLQQLEFAGGLFTFTFLFQQFLKRRSLETKARRANKKWLKQQSKNLRRAWFEVHFGPNRVSLDFEEYRLSWKKPGSKNFEYYADSKFCIIRYSPGLQVPRVKFPKAEYKINESSQCACVNWGTVAIVEIPT